MIKRCWRRCNRTQLVSAGWMMLTWVGKVKLSSWWTCSEASSPFTIALCLNWDLLISTTVQFVQSLTPPRPPLRPITAMATRADRDTHTRTYTRALLLIARLKMHRFIRPRTADCVFSKQGITALCNYTTMGSTTLIMEPPCATGSPGWICSHQLNG